MVSVATGNTAETLSPPRGGVDRPARGACLRAVLRRDLYEGPSGPSELVAQHVRKRRPACVGYVSGEIAADHIGDLKLLYHHDPVRLGYRRREAVEKVLALTPHLPVDSHNAEISFFSFPRPFLFPGGGPLRPDETNKRAVVVLRVWCQVSVGVREKVRDAPVDGDHGRVTHRRSRCFHLAGDRDEPLVSVALQCAGLRLPFVRPVHHGPELAKLRETDGWAVDPPRFRMWLTQPQISPAFPFPTRHTPEALEATLDGPVELNEELCAGVPRHVGEPREISSEISKLVDLVKRRRIVLVGSRQAHLPLFQGQVPEESECALPPVDPSFLLSRRIDAVPERLASDHTPKPYTLPGLLLGDLMMALVGGVN